MQPLRLIWGQNFKCFNLSRNDIETQVAKKLHRVIILAVELGSTFCNNYRDFFKSFQVAERDCNLFLKPLQVDNYAKDGGPSVV